MTNKEAIEILTDLYQLLYYAERLKCKSAGIGEEYYNSTREALEKAVLALREREKIPEVEE